MFGRFIHFIKYNNLSVFIILAFFVVGSGVFAQTEVGQEMIGEKQTRIEGVDNTLLLDVDLSVFDMDFKVETLEEDDKYYYVTYTYLDLVKKDNAWLYQLNEKKRKISKRIKKDLGMYLAEELREHFEDRLRELSDEKEKALAQGEETREEVTEYSGLVGKILAATGEVFIGYEPVKTREIPSPSAPLTILNNPATSSPEVESPVSAADNLTDIYNDYINENDPDSDNIFGSIDNCPNVNNPDQIDSNNNGVGDVCEVMPELGDIDLVNPDTTPATLEVPTTTEDIIIENQDQISTSSEAVEVEIIELPQEDNNATTTNL